MSKRRIRITWGDLTKRYVTAEIHGAFAVHRAKGVTGWMLTHVKSGLGFCDALPTKAAVLGLLCSVLSIKGLDWDFSDPDTVKAWPKVKRAAVKRVIRAAQDAGGR